MTFHAEILTDRQTRVLDAVSAIAHTGGFYLAGGTAVALRFGHRRSEDFDWFAPELGRPEILAAELRSAGLALEQVEMAEGTLNCRIEGVKVSFLKYAYPLLAPVDEWPDKRIVLASVADLAAMKLLAIAQRGARKDFVDVHELLRRGSTIEAMLADFQQKFAADTTTVLRGLVYFDDAELEPMPEMISAFDWPSAKDLLRNAVQEVLR
ncbi:MAG: nucleotidyl transferase AbiEii/AbiGii toxin family protein [Vicinamibacterales bacterium]